MLPATKYENTLFVVADDLEAYLLKLGIFRVSALSLERPKGLSKDDLGAASATPLRCWQPAMAARAAGSCCLAQARSMELEAAARDMAGEKVEERRDNWRG